MNKQEWLSARAIGSSDAPTIMEVSEYKTPYELWTERVFGSEQADNSAMKRGRELEEPARQRFEQLMGVSVFAKSLKHTQEDFMTANLDGIDLDFSVLVEIKNVKKEYHEMAKAGIVPEIYYPQCQHQLEVVNSFLVEPLKKMYYFSACMGDDVVVEVKLDVKYITKMKEKEKKFWDCILNATPPALIDRDYVSQSQEWIDLAKKRIALAAQIKELEEENSGIMEQLIAKSNNKNARGGGFQLTRSAMKGRVDYAQIPELKSVNLEGYRKSPSVQWRLTGT